jgi:heme-degrading monooxygenase HmoA
LAAPDVRAPVVRGRWHFWASFVAARGRSHYSSTQNSETNNLMPYISKTPKPPYYAVIFTSINADTDHTEHTKMYKRMVEIAEGYEGYIGIEPARNPDGSGVAVIYWKDLETIEAFARHPEHLIAKKKGREIWYSHYLIRICKVERSYGRPEGSVSAS